jgi:hypothetical protein
MKAKEVSSRCELFILPDGTILGHNLTPAMAAILSKLNPADRAMQQRSRRRKRPVSK